MFKFFKKKKEEVKVLNSYSAKIYLYDGDYEEVVGDYECMLDFQNDISRLMKGLTFTGTKLNDDVILFRTENVKSIVINGTPLKEDYTNE